MSFSFSPHSGLIQVAAVVQGPNGDVHCSLALDTGAGGTVISDAVLLMAGYAPSLAPQHVQVATASGLVFAPRLPVHRLSASGNDRIVLPVVALTVPPGAGVQGLLGLDFFRGQTLKIDFRTGLLDLH
jgi:hypothetical protein